MASLYPKVVGGSGSYTMLGTLTAGGGGLNGSYSGATASSTATYASSDVAAAASRLEPPYRSSYAADPLSFYGSSSTFNPVPPPAPSWQTMDSYSLKRPAQEVYYSEDPMSKRARFEMAPVFTPFPQRPGEKDCVYYMRTRTCSFGATCKYDHPAWVPAGGIPDWKEVSAPATKAQPLPVREGEPNCAFYMKTGICKFGSKCKFNHPESNPIDTKIGEAVNGATKFSVINGDAGVFAAKPASAFNAKGLPLRPGESDCTFYNKTGSCKFGSTCRFNHPEKAAASVALQQSQAASVAPMLGAFTAPYGNFSVFPGTMPDYGYGLPTADYGMPSLAPTTTVYPQRPGETSCTYYMKTGICKFGNTCKFHHPLDRKDPMTKVTLAGFPRREGEQPCAFYMKTGTCKFALTCKFDHPPPGEAAAKAVAQAGTKSEELGGGEAVPTSNFSSGC